MDLKGIIPPLVTALNHDETIDVQGLKRIVRHMLTGGVHGIFALGSAGEFAALSDDAKIKVMETVVEEVAGKAPVIAGTGDAGSKRALENTKIAQKIGVDAAVLVPPYYFLVPGQEEIYNFYREIADAVDIPIVIYNNPALTKIMVGLETVVKLADHQKIVAIKDSSSNFVHFQRLLFSLKGRGDFKIFQGDEDLIAASVLLGADGAVSALANLVPQLCVSLYQAAHRRDIEKALELQGKLTNFFGIYGEEGKTWTAGLKYALKLIGLCGETVTRPFLPLNEMEKREVEKVVRREGLLS